MMFPELSAADAELRRLETALTATATNLVDLDDNPDRVRLDKTKLTGKTAAAWADATKALSQLWDGYQLLAALVAKARGLRDQRKMNDVEKSEYQHLALGRSISLGERTVPLAERRMTDAGTVSFACTPAEMLAVMEASFTTAVTVAAQAGQAWQKLMPAAADIISTLDRVRALTHSAGSRSAAIDEADRRMGAFTSTLSGDPLGADERELDAIRALVARADAERTSAAELRATLDQRLADAHKLLDELTAAREGADKAWRAAADRFQASDLASVRPMDLRPDLAAIDALAAAGHWNLISPKLADWTRRARERLTQLRDAAARNTGLLTGRNELRGRLDAYRAKALSRGRSEDGTLSLLAETARTALYAAPCDLDAGRRAVDAYQEALTAMIAREGR